MEGPMAQKLKNFEFNRGKNNYDWEKWCDQSKWKLEIGKDFKGTLQLFRASFSSQCKRLGLKGRTQTTDDKKYIIVQALSYVEDGPKVSKKSVKKKTSNKK